MHANEGRSVAGSERPRAVQKAKVCSNTSIYSTIGSGLLKGAIAVLENPSLVKPVGVQAMGTLPRLPLPELLDHGVVAQGLLPGH